jgi:hypothetical protein
MPDHAIEAERVRVPASGTANAPLVNLKPRDSEVR